MIKWFCDICGLEIVEPENPVRVGSTVCGKSRDDEEIGWGHDRDIVRVFCHKACAATLESEIKSALESTRRMVASGRE